jgi:GT2 family glycosyltransferase
MSAPPPRVSVVVPTFQRRESARRLLHALCRQTLPPSDFEVLVAVDGSTDGTFDMLLAFAAPFRLRSLPAPNAGRAAACNRGIRVARGELLVILDDDMEPGPGFLEAHLSAHGDTGSRLGVLGAVPIEAGPGTAPVTRFVAQKFARHLERLAAGGEVRYRSFYSGNFSISRALLLELGLFDEGYTEYGNEDTELALRLLAAGVSLQYRPDALAHQHYEKDFRALARDSRAKGRTAVLTTRKHPEKLGPFDLQSFRASSDRWSGRSPKWRLLRGAVLATAPYSALAERALIALVRAVERFEPARLPVLYLFAIDVFYWLGVESAAREAPGAGTLQPPAAAAHGPQLKGI